MTNPNGDLYATLRRIRPDAVQVVDPLRGTLPVAIPTGRTKWPAVVSTVQAMRYERVELMRNEEVVAVVHGDTPAPITEEGRQLVELLALTEAAADRAAARVLEAVKPALSGMERVLTAALATMESERARAEHWEQAAKTGQDDNGGREDIIPLLLELLKDYRASRED